MNCPFCNSTIENNASFCTVCGANLRPAPNNDREPNETPAQPEQTTQNAQTGYSQPYTAQPEQNAQSARAGFTPPFTAQPEQNAQSAQAGFAPPYTAQPNRNAYSAAPGQPYAAPAAAPVYRAPSPWAGVNFNMEPEQSKTAQSLGIAGLVLNTFFSFPLIGAILSLIGIINAGKAAQLTGGAFSPSAKVGRICGIIGLILGILRILTVVGFILIIVLVFGGLTGLFEELPEIVDDFPGIVEEFFDGYLRLGMFF